MADDVKSKANALKDQGNTALNAGQLERAIELYTKGIELDPTNHVLFSNRSAAYAKIRKYVEALNDAESTINIKPDWAKGYGRKGAALAYLKRSQEALQAYEEGLKYDPQNAQLKEGKSEVEAQLMKGSKSFSNPLSDPNVFEKLGRDPRTRDLLTDPSYLQMIADLRKDPSNMNHWMKDPRLLTTFSVLLGLDFESGDDGDEEMPSQETNPTVNCHTTDSKKDTKTNSEDTEMVSVERKQALEAKEAGNQAYKKRQFEEALENYKKAVSLDPTDMTFLTNTAAVYFEQKKFAECVKECESAIEVGRENRADFKIIAKAYSRMAVAYFKLKDLRNARTYYEKSLTEHRTPETLKKLSEVNKIIAEEERKAYIDPDKALEEKNFGNQFFQKGDYPAAMKHYSEAIKRNPEDAKLYSNRAACYQKLAEFQLALKDCEVCVKLDPSFVKGHIRKGLAFMALKDHNKATQAFNKALELDPNNQEALDGYRKCSMASNSDPEEVRKRAMADPDVQKILSDPAMRLILEQMQSDPRAVHEHLKNPDIAAKIQKLLESGLITIR